MARPVARALCHAMLLLLAAAAGAGAQTPSSQSRTSAVGTLFPDSAAAPVPNPPSVAGRVRQLVCRGAAGTRITFEQDPSPRNPLQVAVKLAYRRNPVPSGLEYTQLESGACTWNPLGDAGLPAEPGVVHFDLDRRGLEYVPDPESLGRWLSDPQHYWVFYVDDATDFSISFGSYKGQFRGEPTPSDKSTTSNATALHRERLRCRGGAGYAFDRKGRVGPNLVAITLSYRVAFSAAGQDGKGLQPGQCAWGDRTDARMEPGLIGFTTPGNAQLKQSQSGGTVDRSPTAAERWPDAHTIPAYLKDSTHYWTFVVSLANPDSALTHRAWKPVVAGAIASVPASEAPTTPQRADPGPAAPYDPSRSRTSATSTIGAVGDRREDAGSTTSNIGQVWEHMRDVTASTLLESAAVRFVARPGAAPTVRLSRRFPEDEPGTGFKTFLGEPTQMFVHEKPEGITSAYTASQSGLNRDTRYPYIIDVPGDGNRIAREQSVGEVRTWKQTAEVVLTEIYIVSDGDTDGPGDLQFTFAAEDGRRTIGAEGNGGLQWNDGSRNQISGVAITGLEADRLRIHVSGVDDDQVRTSRTPTSDPCVDSYAPVGKNQLYEWNCARTEVDLTQYSGQSASIPLYIRSMPLRNGSTLMFDVRGYVKVTRQ